jgi:hypothetical protein
VCYQSGKSTSTLWLPTREHQKLLITNVSYPLQEVSTSVDIMQRAKVVNRGRYGNMRYSKILKGNEGKLARSPYFKHAVPQKIAGFRTYVKKVDIAENLSVHLSKHKEENKKSYIR